METTDPVNGEVKVIDVADGKPQTISLKQQTTVLLKGSRIPEQKLVLVAGTYICGEVQKNIFTTNGRGGYDKVGKQYFLVAERVS